VTARCCGNTVPEQEPTGTTYFDYDGENHMVHLQLESGGHCYYQYDADGKRVRIHPHNETPTVFVYQGPDMLRLQMEKREDGETVAQYTIGAHGGLEAQRRGEDTSVYHFDMLGSTLALTDADEAITDTLRYEAWGGVFASTGNTTNRHTWVGRERYIMTKNSDLALLGHRYYMPSIGRFTTVDPVEELHEVVYCAGRPSVFTDPSGLWGCDPVQCARRSIVFQTPKRPFERTFQGICPSGYPGTYHVIYEKWWDVREVWQCIPDPDSYFACLGKQVCARVSIIPHRKIGRRGGRDWFCIPDWNRVPPVPTPGEWDEWLRRCQHICRLSCEIVNLIGCVLVCAPAVEVPVVGVPLHVACDVSCHELGTAVTCESLCDGLCEENWHV